MWGAELSAGGRDRVSSLAPSSLRRPPPGRARRKLTAHSSLLPRPERRCWRPFLLGPWDSGTLSPAGSPRAWMSLDLAQPSSLPLNPCLEVGSGTRERRTELGWPEELALVSSWTTSPCPHPDSQSLKRLDFPRMGVSRRGASGYPAYCQGSLRAGCLISLENGSAALIMNSIIEYIAFVPFFTGR